MTNHKRFEEFFDKITDIFKKSLEEKNIKGEIKITPIEFKGLTIDLPRKEKGSYHGSSYDILCNIQKTWCKINGDLVVDIESEETVSRDLERSSNCMIFDTHRHIGRKEEPRQESPRQESHIHFICKDTDKDDTIKMINFLKDY